MDIHKDDSVLKFLNAHPLTDIPTWQTTRKFQPLVDSDGRMLYCQEVQKRLENKFDEIEKGRFRPAEDELKRLEEDDKSFHPLNEPDIFDDAKRELVVRDRHFQNESQRIISEYRQELQIAILVARQDINNRPADAQWLFPDLASIEISLRQAGQPLNPENVISAARKVPGNHYLAALEDHLCFCDHGCLSALGTGLVTWIR